jgi:hypothetical protein
LSLVVRIGDLECYYFDQSIHMGHFCLLHSLMISAGAAASGLNDVTELGEFVVTVCHLVSGEELQLDVQRRLHRSMTS